MKRPATSRLVLALTCGLFAAATCHAEKFSLTSPAGATKRRTDFGAPGFGGAKLTATYSR